MALSVTPTDEMKTLTVGQKIYEIVDDQAREDVSEVKADFSQLPYSVYRPSDAINGYYLNSSGVATSVAGWSITPYLTVGSTATYYMESPVTSDNVKNCFYDENKVFISAFKTATAGLHTIETPENAKYVRFSVRTDEVNDFSYSSAIFIADGIGVIHPSHIYNCNIAKTVKDFLVNGQYYDVDGTITSSTSWARSKLYPVSEGDVVSIKKAAYQCATFFDANEDYASKITVSGTNVDKAFSVPSGVAYMGLNVLLATISDYSCTVNGLELDAKYTIGWLDIVQSIWYGKTYISHGDSITWRDGHTWGSGPDVGKVARGYQTIFSEAVGLKSYNNQGKSGWSMAVVNDNGIVNTVLAIPDYSVYDLCTIACGTNDFKLNVPLGTLGVIGDTTFDDTTFYGAYRKAVEYILTSSPTIRLVLMTPLQRDNSGYDVNYTNSAGHKLIDYVNAVKEIGEMYGLPVCDMYANSGFTKKTLATYTLDGLHPNTTGYIRMGNYLTGFLNAIGN